VIASTPLPPENLVARVRFWQAPTRDNYFQTTPFLVLEPLSGVNPRQPLIAFPLTQVAFLQPKKYPAMQTPDYLFDYMKERPGVNEQIHPAFPMTEARWQDYYLTGCDAIRKKLPRALARLNVQA
jgi:hypothetical protein